MNSLKRFTDRIRTIVRAVTEVQTAGENEASGETGPSPVIKPKITVTHHIAGQSVTFTGMNFPSNVSVNMSMVDMANLTPPVPMGAVMTDAAGRFTRTLTIPPALRSAERLEIQARGEGVLARDDFDNRTAV